MKQWKKRGLVLSLAGILAAASLTGCKASTVDNDEVLATVGDAEISYGVANFYARLMQARYEDFHASISGSTPAEFWEQNILGQVYEDTVKAELIENLENMYLVRQHAEEYDIALTEEDQKEIQKAAADFEEDNSLETKERISGYSKYIEEYLSLVTIYRKMDAPMKEGVDDDISDEEAAQKSMKYVFFSYTKEEDEDGNSEDLSDEEKEELKKDAEKFAKDLKADKDKDIDAIAEEVDLEVQSVTFDSETKTPDTSLIEAADELEENEVTDVIETDSGLYVAVVTSLLDREATDEKKESMIEERRDQQFDALLQEWRGETPITVNSELWQTIDFKTMGMSDKQNQEGRADLPENSDQSDGSQEQETSESDETAEE